jgi:hypothetical protein
VPIYDHCTAGTCGLATVDQKFQKRFKIIKKKIELATKYFIFEVPIAKDEN